MTTDGGRFDFEDGGAYVGGWSEGKAHGLGLVTGPRGQGEFAGYWEDGFEASGVYIWPSGNTYEGEWRHGKRHGVGVEVKGRWVYRGEWMTGFKGRYGVRESEASGARYEGTWQLGMQDGAGVETYSDGSTYSGCWFHGTRHGLGIRQSVSYGLAAHYKDERRLRESLTSLRSQDEDGTGGGAGGSTGAAIGADSAAAAAAAAARRLDESRGGFVLRGRVIDAGTTSGAAGSTAATASGKRSLTRTLMNKLRRQRSAGDVSDQRRSPGRYAGSMRSAYSMQSSVATDHSSLAAADYFEEIVDPATTEAYFGDWKQDKRAGLGVAERSDGLKYEGEWDGNKKHGYGATTFPDGSVESGKYKQNLLVANTAKRSKLFLIKSSRLRERVETAVREARNARAEAVKKAENAMIRQQASRQKADLACTAAEKARQDAEMARKLAKEYAPDFHQPGVEFLKRRMESDVFNTLTLTTGGGGGNGGGGGMGGRQARRGMTEEIPSRGGSGGGVSSGNSLQVDGTLQVGGGGSRRGSFRAVRRGSVGGGGGGERPEIRQQPPTPQPNHQQQQQQQQPAFPASASSTAPPVTVAETITKLHAAPAAAASAAASAVGLQTRRGMHGNPSQHQLLTQQQQQMLASHIEPLTSALSNVSSSDHFDQYRSVLPASSRKRDSGLGRDDYSIDANSRGNGGATGPAGGGDSDSGLSEATSGSAGGSSLSRSRRRTMPSLLSAPPVKPASVGAAAAQSVAIDDMTKSVENLKDTDFSYIIENGIRKRVQLESGNRRQQQQHQQLQQPLPRQYRIESQAQLAKDLGEGSLPDVTVCQQIQRHGMMSREEVSRLSEARRLELLRLEERRRQGEIIIRLADLKDWCKEHLLLLFVFIINTGLAVLFISLLAAPDETD
ncbi:hypothetical protein BOX15_Mlig034492g1 [Macrostomum lignano]|uniref:Junctophilin n=1 Tax=Macrostomum lignano TaxID=282301 RepID=A0A267EHH0_9PLAT|nr:hypothetical protein BOX15_Mlig034492g1 [Macrostomum lignano]